MSLYLTKLQLINFKGFAGQNPPITFHGPDGVTPGSGLNILVGENNGGKSTIFSAIRFLYDGSGTDPILPKISDFGAVDDEGKRSISLWHKQTPGIPGVDFHLERLYNILQ